MLDLGDLVYYVIMMLVAAVVIGLLWFLITYIEKKCAAAGVNAPLVFMIIKIVFVVLLVLFLIGCLMSLAGVPLIKMPVRNRAVGLGPTTWPLSLLV